MYDIYFTEMASRALLGDLRNMTRQCLADTRPRAQYMHFYRLNHKKIKDLLENWNSEVPKCQVLWDILEYYNTHPKCTFNTQRELSQDIQNILFHD